MEWRLALCDMFSSWMSRMHDSRWGLLKKSLKMKITLVEEFWVGHIFQNSEFLKNPIKEEETEDKVYHFCDVHGSALFIPDTPVPLGVTDRARQTLPPGLEIWESSIPHVGQGETVSVGAHFRPYPGELVERKLWTVDIPGWYLRTDSMRNT